MSRVVLVTGAAGFVGSHIVEQLLSDPQNQVRGTVRSLKSKEKYAHLLGMPNAGERLTLVEADLTVPGSFDAAMEGVNVCMHVASPYIIDVADPQRDLVDPAVEGTRAVLEACLKSGTVKQVVLTSSYAAITDEPPAVGKVFTEADWNDKSSLTRNPYYYSKTLAEKFAWDYVEKTSKDAFKLVVINPFLVIGPSHTATVNQSNKVILDVYTGDMRRVDFSWGFVDVRDVAKAHILAMNTPSAHGRYICADTVLNMEELIQILDRDVPGASTAMISIPTWLARAASHMYPAGTGSYMRANIGKGKHNYDNFKIRNELGLTFTPLVESLRDTVNDARRWKHIR